MRLSRWTVRAGLALAPLLVLAACGRDGAPDGPPCYASALPPATGRWVRAVLEDGDQRRIVLEDGREFRVPVDPERIVSTLPGITESIDYLGGFNRVVAVSEHCDRPVGVDMLPAVSVMPVNYEVLTELQPDMVLVDDTLSQADLDEMGRRLPGLLPLRSRSLADVSTSMDLLARVLDTEEAQERALRFRRNLEGALARVALPPGESPVRVLLLAQIEPIYALGPGSLLDDMLRACGAINIACDLGRPSGPFSVELVRTRQPFWILSTGDPVPESLKRLWASVPAVLEERVTSANANDLVRAGPRTIEALERLADVLHDRADPAILAREP